MLLENTSSIEERDFSAIVGVVTFWIIISARPLFVFTVRKVSPLTEFANPTSQATNLQRVRPNRNTPKNAHPRYITSDNISATAKQQR